MNERYLHISSEEFTNIRLLPSDWDIYYFTDLSLSLWLSKEKFKYETHEVNLLIIKGIMIDSSIIRIISMV